MEGTSPHITSGRVELRLISPRHGHQLFQLARDPEVSQYLQWPAHESIDDSLEYIADTHRLWQARTAWLPGIFDVERNQLVGCIGLSEFDRVNHRAEAGTWIGKPFQRSGYNRDAKQALLDAAFSNFDLERVEFLVRADNEQSLRSMRTMSDVTEEGRLARRLFSDGTFYDAYLFVALRSRAS